MQLRTYRARTMADALAEVKKDLGRDAVILHTRTFKVGGWFGIGGHQTVEITASADAPAVRPRRPAPSAQARSPREPAAVGAVSAAARAYGAPLPRRDEPAAIAQAPARESSIAMADPPVPVPPQAPLAPAPVASGPDVLAFTAALTDELATIRRMVGHVVQSSRQAALRAGREAGAAVPGAMPEALFEHYLRLLESEVAAEIADEVVGHVRDELSSAELADPSIVRQTVLRHLSAMIPADADVPTPGRGGDGRPLTIALVGPTGVGKTTTVAKLAAAYKLRHGRRVGLVTCDTYRIAAVDQLRTYADIIGLPLKVALSGAEMQAACESLADCDVILIDTAGRSPNDADRLSELRRFIDAARPHQTHLVLSSTASEAALVAAAGRFSHVGPDRVIFTKLDEAVNFGVLVTVARRIDLRLSYVTTGQEVPDHIEVGRPDRLARLVVEPAPVRGGAAMAAGVAR